ncbi:MAG: hypothetical protein GY904_14085 [Planctomycetaceae bacterium]|nr:hypothetical protein [Planctomycetaceae bacterium]
MFSQSFKSLLSSIAVYLPFLVISSGGSGLHHAPLFGLHGCCGGHSHASQHLHACCCTHHHPADKPADDSDTTLGEKNKACSVCDFFATKHASVDDEDTEIPQSVSLLAPTILSVGTLRSANGFLARGPPITD